VKSVVAPPVELLRLGDRKDFAEDRKDSAGDCSPVSVDLVDSPATVSLVDFPVAARSVDSASQWDDHHVVRSSDNFVVLARNS
jgi:hypothetical protein